MMIALAVATTGRLVVIAAAHLQDCQGSDTNAHIHDGHARCVMAMRGGSKRWARVPLIRCSSRGHALLVLQRRDLERVEGVSVWPMGVGRLAGGEKNTHHIAQRL